MKRLTAIMLVISVLVVAIMPVQAFAMTKEEMHPMNYVLTEFASNMRPTDAEIVNEINSSAYNVGGSAQHAMYLRVNDAAGQTYLVVVISQGAVKWRVETTSTKRLFIINDSGTTNVIGTVSKINGTNTGTRGTFNAGQETAPGNPQYKDIVSVQEIQPGAEGEIRLLENTSQPYKDHDLILYRYQLEQAQYTNFMAVKSKGYRYFEVYINPKEGSLPILESSHPLPITSDTVIDISSALKGNKADFSSSGYYKIEVLGWNDADYKTPESEATEGWTWNVWYDANAYAPRTGYDPNDPERQITPPSPPQNSWDVVGWLRYIVEWLIYIVDSVTWVLSQIGGMISNLFNESTGFIELLRRVFSFLPPEVTTLIAIGMGLAVLLRVFGR